MAKDDEIPAEATVQMSTEQIKRLHAELQAQRAASNSAETVEAEREAVLRRQRRAEADADVEYEAQYEAEPRHEGTTEVEEVPEAPIEKPAKAKPEAKPAKPAKVERARDEGAASSGGGLLVVGGIGALVAGLAGGVAILTMFQGMTQEIELRIAGLAGLCAGHLLLALGMFGAVSRTSGIAALIGMLHVLASASLGFLLLGGFRVIQLDADLGDLALLLSGIVPGTAWLLSAIWSFASSGPLGGAMASLHGIFALLGGGAGIAHIVLVRAEVFRPDDDLAYALQLAAPSAILLAAIFIAIPMFGRLRRAPVG